VIEPEHISDLRWDQLIAGDLAADAADAARTHAASCERCAARLAELTADARAFTVPRRSSRSPIWISAMAAVALAAAALLVVRMREQDVTRTKGGAGAQLVLVGGPRLAPLASGDRVAPGDSLQATYTADRDGFGAVLARDGAGTRTTYVPPRGDVMVPLPAGTSRSFPSSTVLDAVVGEEAIVFLWCERALPIQPLLAQLETLVAPAGCTLHRVVLDKR
jgi:hypothetical protein